VYEYPSVQELQSCDFSFNFPVTVAKHFLLGGLGVEGQQSDLCEIPVLPHVTPFYGVDQKREPVGQNQVYLSWNNKYEVFLPLFFARHKEER
jgi:hypothetical protein